MPLIHSIASVPDFASTAATLTKPSSSISILAPVVSLISLITAPPLPITSRILSLWTWNVVIVGA